MTDLNVGTGGTRNEKPLTVKQSAEAVAYAVKLGMPRERVGVSDHLYTSYGAVFDVLQIGTDVFPLEKPASSANSNISMKGAIAHELIGHRNASLCNRSQKNDIFEEAQASFRAAN